jgi:uncharacterized protein
MKSFERRYASGEIEVRAKGKQLIFEGHAAVFGRLSQNLGGFVERCNPGMFAKTIDEADVRALMNHDSNFVLGRNRAQTLSLAEDQTGLYYRVIAPDTSYARDLAELMGRGDVNQSSFGFFTLDDHWGLTENEFPLRDLLEVALVDVSVVTFPAYTDTDSSVSGRAALRSLSLRAASDEEIRAVESGDLEAVKRVITAMDDSTVSDSGPGDTHSEETRSDGRDWASEIGRLAALE